MKKVFLSVLMMLVGLGLFIFSIYRIIDYKEKNKTYIETEATVIEYAERDDDQQAIIVQYEVDGKSYTHTADSSSNHPKSIGSKVKIKYNPENPEQMIWSKDISNILLPAVGLLFTVAGIYCIYDNAKRLKKDKERVEA
jgi:uncharacterized protein YxeA